MTALKAVRFDGCVY